jgi:hypothetical protein
MRIRQIKPEFWRDKPMAKLPAEVRLFYIGLWMEADDSGWLRWDVAEIGHDLYGYRGERLRERQCRQYADAIVALPGEPRLVILDCGHAYLSRLTIHQRFSGATKQTHTYHREHQDRCIPQIPAGTRESPQTPARIGTVSEGSGGAGGNDEEARGETVATLRAILADPSKKAAHKAAKRSLEQMGYAA